MEDWIKDGNGRMRRVHKRYVDVVAHMRDDGFLEPLSIAWRDGRTFRVTQVIEVGEFRPGFEGFFTAKYRVSIANRQANGIEPSYARDTYAKAPGSRVPFSIFTPFNE